MTNLSAWYALLLLAPMGTSAAEATVKATVETGDEATIEASTNAEAARSAAADYFNKGANPQIQQAAWSSRTVFNVGVHYMGADQSAIADEVCPLLTERGLASNIKVRVIDINTMGSNQQRWDVVGQASCR